MTLGLRLDRRGAALAALIVFVAAVTAALSFSGPAGVTQGVDTSTPGGFGEDAGGKATAGAAWAAAEVVIAAAAIALVLLFRRAPGWVRRLAKHNLAIFALMYLGVVGLALRSFIAVAVATMLAYSTYRVSDRFGLWWILNDVAVVAIAIGGGIVVGLKFGVAGMVAGLVGLTIYDHAFANQQRLMFSLARPMLANRLPVLFFVPDQLRFDWDEVVGVAEDAENYEHTDDGGWGLGTADLLLVAGFVAAVASSSVLVPAGGRAGALAAVVAGLAVAGFRLSYEMETRGSGAGLPSLSAGMLVPYAAVAGVWVLVG